MRKFLFLSAACLAMTVSANAGNFYVGANHQFVTTDYRNGLFDKWPQDYGGWNYHVGYRHSRYSGAEIGYETASGSMGRNQLKVNGFTFDSFGYLPMTKYLSFIGTAGVMQQHASGEVPKVVDGKEIMFKEFSVNQAHFRFGAGAELLFKDFDVHAIGRYQFQDFAGRSNYGLTFNIGTNIYL